MCGANYTILFLAVCTSYLSSCQAEIVLLGPTGPVPEDSSLEFYCIVDKSTTDGDNKTITIERSHEDDDKFENLLTWPEYKGENQSTADMIVELVNLTDDSYCLAVCIQNVSYNNSGKYRCKSGEQTSNEVNVKVKNSTEDTNQQYRRCLGQKSTKRSDTVTLTCISKTSSPEELEPKWFENGSPHMQSASSSNASLGSSNVSFVSMETVVNTENVYTCQANPGGEKLSCKVSFPSAFVSVEKNDKYVGINVFISLNSAQIIDTVRIDSYEMSNNVCYVEKNLLFSKDYVATSEEGSFSTSPTSTVDSFTSSVTGSTASTTASTDSHYNFHLPIFIVALAYVIVSSLLFIIMFVRFIRRRVRLWKLSHIYATFNPAVAPLAEIPRRNLSRRPTRSLPPIPTDDAAQPDAHYANAHLKLSQHSLPAHFRHSMQSFPSDSAVWKAGCRNSLPLHASNVSAQNALYFFTETVEECDEMKECADEKPPEIPYTISKSKPQPPKPFFKHHTLNVRSSTMVGKPRASDYQNWFQRFKLSTSCPSIAGMEEGGEVKQKPEIVCQAKSSFEKWKRRTQIRRRLSSIYRERTPPPAATPGFLPTFRRPFSESFAQSENPYVERGTIPSCYSK